MYDLVCRRHQLLHADKGTCVGLESGDKESGHDSLDEPSSTNKKKKKKKSKK